MRDEQSKEGEEMQGQQCASFSDKSNAEILESSSLACALSCVEFKLCPPNAPAKPTKIVDYKTS